MSVLGGSNDHALATLTKGKSTITLSFGAWPCPRGNFDLVGRMKSLPLPWIGPQFHSHPVHSLVTYWLTVLCLFLLDVVLCCLISTMFIFSTYAILRSMECCSVGVQTLASYYMYQNIQRRILY